MDANGMRVTGVSAIMIYANDAQALAQWYERHLGIVTRRSPEDGNWYGDIRDPGTGTITHFGIYPAADTLPDGRRAVMVNYRVEDFAAALDAIGAAGIEIEREVDEAYGRFAYIRDPEGNPLEIYAPVERDG